MLIVWLLVFAFCLFILIKAADYFTDASEKIGTILKLPPVVIGILIVAVGTSAPELATSIFGVLKGEAAILAGNIVGTVIANILLGLGLVVVISWRVAKFNWDSVSNDMSFFLSAVVLLVLTCIDGIFNFWEAIIFLVGYVIYVIYSLDIKKQNPKKTRDDLHKEIKSKIKQDLKDDGEDKSVACKEDLTKLILIFIVSLLFILISAKYTIDSLLEIASIVGLGSSILATSIVAIGTSLPEISVAVSSARKGNFDMVLGNIIGSNIFDIFVVFGAVGLFANIPIPHEIIYVALPFLVATIFVQWLVTMDRQITITEGMMMTLLYIVFIVKLYNIF
ncbi:MAG: calcium/sodium antiporter [Patescibacteria group bacterium]